MRPFFWTQYNTFHAHAQIGGVQPKTYLTRFLPVNYAVSKQHDKSAKFRLLRNVMHFITCCMSTFFPDH